MTSYSIGYRREDGDFAILATLNNNSESLNCDDFEAIKDLIFTKFYNRIDSHFVEVIERQDAPDYVDLGDGM